MRRGVRKIPIASGSSISLSKQVSLIVNLFITSRLPPSPLCPPFPLLPHPPPSPSRILTRADKDTEKGCSEGTEERIWAYLFSKGVLLRPQGVGTSNTRDLK